MKVRRHLRISLWRLRLRLSVTRLVAAASLLFLCVSAQAQDPQLVPILQGLLHKYKGCILERYETQQDMISRGLDPGSSGLASTSGLQSRDLGVLCAAGNICTLASRQATYANLEAQANRGDPANFEAKLKQAIPRDCFQCQKHQEWHTKHVHCTMDCGGNNGLTQGPCFEGCKAGVDVTKLVNDIANDIHGALQNIGLARSNEPQATGGLTVATNYSIVDPAAVPEQKCDPRPVGIFVAPSELLDWTPTDAPPFKQVFTNYSPPPSPRREQYNPAALSINDPKLNNVKANIGANEGRLRSDLRETAAHRNPLESLCKSAAAFAVKNQIDGKAFADLSVTGRHAFAAFRAQPPQQAQILSCLRSNSVTRALPQATLEDAVSKALDRAYRVLHIVRTGGWPGNPESPAPGTPASPACSQDRAGFGYIAVSGEDDQPHRPVNVASAEFPQYDLDVPVVVRSTHRTLSVHTRYMIAHTNTPPAGQLGNCAFAGSTIPADREPILAQDAEIFLYIPGMDSRLEEALDLTHALHRLGRERHKNYTVISMDLPTAGYADNLDQNLIQPLAFDGHAGGGVTGLEFTPIKYNAPIVDFTEDFIVSFVNTLNTRYPSLNLTQHLSAFVGGSEGGNMSFRLGRPRADAPWITTVVPWSPASIWPSLDDDPPSHAGLATPWYFAGGDPNYLAETPGARRSFFYGGFDWQSKVAGVVPVGGAGFAGMSGGGRPQAEYWTRDTWECKASHMRFARVDRYETYDHNFRLWHWRLGMEQLQYSQQIPKPGTNPPEPLYLSNTKRMLLLCGMEDVGADLCKHTREVAPKMTLTPGRALFLKETGHSIHNERPNFLARQIVEFVDGPARAQSLHALLAKVCPTIDGATCAASRPAVSKSQEATTVFRAIVTVTDNGQPIPGATVAVEGSRSVTDLHGAAVVTYRLASSRMEVTPTGIKRDVSEAQERPRPIVGQANAAGYLAPRADISKSGFQSASVDLPTPLINP